MEGYEGNGERRKNKEIVFRVENLADCIRKRKAIAEFVQEEARPRDAYKCLRSALGRK